MLLSSLRARLCKSVTKMPLDFCVTKSSLIEFPVYISNLVGIPVMRPMNASSTGCMLSQEEGQSFFWDHQVIMSES